MTVKRAPAGNEPQRQSPPARGPDPALTHAGPHDSPMSFPTFSISRCHSRCFQSPSVIPDVFNRESRAFPIQGHPNEGTEEKDTGFPLKTCGNDRGYRRARQGRPAGMTGGTGGKVPPHTPSPLAGEGGGEGLSGHDKGTRAGHLSFPTPSTPFCHSRCCQSGIHGFPMQGPHE